MAREFIIRARSGLCRNARQTSLTASDKKIDHVVRRVARWKSELFACLINFILRLANKCIISTGLICLHHQSFIVAINN